jgi:CubicO group peptidase (beta-lactamase class C family)
MHDVMAGYVGRGAVPGIVTLVSRRGEVHVDTIGAKAFDGDPIRRDTIFRISSLTKPIIAVATMILVEECLLRLDEPVDRLLPELADRGVLQRLDGPIDAIVPALRPITTRDLLTMRMGFGFLLEDGDFPILAATSEQQIVMGPPKPATPLAPDEWIRRFATLPLMRQPGEAWMYELAFSVLGVLIARASGRPLETFLRERIFAPLGMKDTGFSVPATSLDRLATCYWTNFETGAFEVYDGVQDSQWSRPPAFPDAAGGLVSTIDDYLAFGQMMLAKGRHGSERILSRPSVELMTSDHLTAAQRAAAGLFLDDSRGWGFGVSVITRRDDVAAVPGRFGWDGGLGTSWYADPSEDMHAILMCQRLADPDTPRLDLDFWTSVYQAIDD